MNKPKVVRFSALELPTELVQAIDDFFWKKVNEESCEYGTIRWDGKTHRVEESTIIDTVLNEFGGDVDRTLFVTEYPHDKLVSLLDNEPVWMVTIYWYL